MVRQIFKLIKGDSFVIDKDITSMYLISFFISKLVGVLYGILRLQTIKLICIHPTTVIKCSSKLNFGKGFNVDRGCYIDALSKEGLSFGNNCSLGLYTTIKLSGSLKEIAGGVKIGNNVGLGTHGYYGCGVGSLEIGDDCIFGNYVSIHPENHNYTDKNTPIRLQGVNSVGGVKIGNDCWIGAKATILDGTKIGNHCIVAAGAVVKGIFPDNVIIGGVPARILKEK